MTGKSVLRGVNAVEGYIHEDIKRQLEQAATTNFVPRSEKALQLAEQVAAETDNSEPVLGLVELLVTRGLRASTPEFDLLVAAQREKVGNVLSDAIAGYVTSIIKLKTVPIEPEERAAVERATPTVRMGPGGPLPAMHYLAVWKEGDSYVPGDVVTFRGTTWHCGLPTRSKPGTDHTWQMMAKSDRERASA